MMTFSSPGKLGDAIHQFPVVYWWHRQHQKPYEIWLDENTCKPLLTLIRCQPGCAGADLKSGIKSYHCGGQPWNFGLEPKDYQDRRVVHLGLRGFPQRQLTLEAFESSKLGLSVSPQELAETPVFEVPEPRPAANRLLLHGMAVCPHSGSSPGFWRFLASIRNELPKLFDEIVWIGSPRDLEVGTRTYPSWDQTLDDHGNLLETARLMVGSRMVIACGSSMAALAGALKVPCIRVHDPIGQAAKVIWSNLGSNQLNATELELRKEWPLYRDHIFSSKEAIA